VLLIHVPIDAHARYSRYLAEILRSEGFAGFGEADLNALTANDLQHEDLLVLPHCAPTPAQVALLLNYVTAGGALLALQPDDRLAAALGLTLTHAARHRADLRIAPNATPDPGPLQLVLPATIWRVPEQAEVQATIGGDPCVVTVPVGAGRATAFGYDLPHCVARLRQGDPDNTDLNSSGLDGIYRPSELFAGQLDKSRLGVPQADAHTALLARVVMALAPRPRIWHYPTLEQRSALIMTSDDDWSTPAQFDALLDGLREHNARCSFYIVPGTHLSRADMDRLERQDGHAFSAHPALDSDRHIFPNTGESQRHFLSRMLRANVARHEREFGRPVRTVRQHIVRWSGYVDAARTLAELGVAMDCNYLSVSPFSIGFMTGSGRPLPFADVDGALIPIYQLATQWTEECLIHPEFVFSERWPVERALREAEAVLQAGLAFATPVAMNSHPVSYATYSAPFVRGAWAAARRLGLPILSADDWLAWTEARAGLRLERAGDGWVLHAARAVDAATVIMPDGAAHTLHGLAAGGRYAVFGAR
jgi:hypothetical protein